MKEKRNILLLIPTFAEHGGTQKMVCELGKLLAKKYKVFECSFDAFNEPHVFKNENEVISLEITKGNLLRKIISYPLGAWRLRKLKKKYNIDVTISNLWAADLLNVLSFSREKMISIGHGSIIGFAGNRLLLRIRRLASWVYKRFDHVVAVNEYLKEELSGLFNISSGKLSYINNFVTFPEQAIIPSPKPPGVKRLITVGRMDLMKNHDPLLRIFTGLKKEVPGLQLVVVGTGPTENSLHILAKKLGLTAMSDYTDTADILFTGFNSNPYTFLYASDIFVFPSKTEGLPLVLVEAMHTGLPVVSSDCPIGGPHMILQGRGGYQANRNQTEETPYGFLMPIPDADDEVTLQQWISVLKELLMNEEKRSMMSIQAKNRADDFSMDKVSHQWINLIDNL